MIEPVDSRSKGPEGEPAKWKQCGSNRWNRHPRPLGSAIGSPLRTDDGRCPGAIINEDAMRQPGQPKPMASKGHFPELDMTIALKEADKSTAGQILSGLKAYVNALEEKSNLDYWNTEEGQKALHVKMEERKRDAKKERQQVDGRIRESLSPLDYTAESKASLSPVSPAEEEWIEIKLTADTGACDTVIPVQMCPSIPIVPSPQSILKLSYEVADGRPIPNLGERRCQMWTEGATAPRNIAMQVADVHKGLLSLSRCADVGYESRFGSKYGCLIDTTNGDVVPLVREGHLYVLKCWVRAAPFGGPDRR